MAGNEPRRKDGGMRPLYGEVEAAIPAGMDYFSDATLDAVARQAELDGAVFDRLLDEAGIVPAPELAATVAGREG